MLSLHNEDKIRTVHVGIKIMAKTRILHRKRRDDKKKQNESTRTTYLAGSFGLSKTSEVSTNDVGGEIEIKFIDDNDVFFFTNDLK